MSRTIEEIDKVVFGETNMTNELKTLKDFGNSEEKWMGYDFVLTHVLKQEAIKEHKLLNDHYEAVKLFPFKILNDRERKLLQSYIKWKNNLTKEDLE